MGGQQSVFTEEELQDYKDLTYLSKKDIIRAHKRWVALAPEMLENDIRATLSAETLLNDLPELRVNPFADRLCKVFSSSESNDGSLCFDDFIDMMSVFSERAPKALKIEYAFRVYDFNDDDLIDIADLTELVSRLCGESELNQEDIENLISKIFQEADLDNDSMLTFAEFEHVISKSPDFENTFRIRL
ncbi:Calcium and integrin-binding protein 1 [Trichoplax sp. H2]|nr:Calcium and integrin-binding protein 1 [Trichoplax sp. H2]|eukprot:RDD43295.1 Calcium and integrin-binding protein 1 [Trichoplax sp. H2]